MNALFTSSQSSIFLIKNGKVDLSKILESLPALLITSIFPTGVQNCQVLVNHSNYLIIRSLHVHVTSIIRHLRQFLFLNAGKYLMFVKFYLVGFLPAQTLIWNWSLLNKASVLTVEMVLWERLFGTVPVLWDLEGQGKNNTLDLGSWSMVPIYWPYGDI